MKIAIKQIKLFLVLFICILTGTVMAQDSHMALNMGPSIPLSDFAAIDNYKSNGYATPGFVLSFEGNYIPTWYFGIGGALTFSTNYPNQDSMLTGLVKELEALDGLPNFPEDMKTDFNIGNWSYANFLIGPTFAYPAGNFQFNFKALIGMSIIMPPNQTLMLFYNDNAVNASSDVQNVKFAYNIGTDIIMKMSGSYSIKLGLEYFSTQTNHSVDIGLNDEVKLPSIERDIKINAIHATLGLAYLF